MKPQVIVASHRRSGTHLVIDAICQNFSTYNNSLPAEVTFLEQFRGPNNQKFSDAKKAVLENSNVFFTHVHNLEKLDDYFQNDPEVLEFYKELLKNSKVIYIQRDGRDVMVSMYEWMKAIEYIDENTPFSEFIRQANNWEAPIILGAPNRVRFWSQHISSWRANQSILYLKYEELLNDFDLYLRQIAKHIDIPMPSKIVNSKRKPFLGFIPYGKWTRRFKKYTIDLIIQPKSHSHFFRKGSNGDHKIYFTKDDLDFFNQEIDSFSKK